MGYELLSFLKAIRTGKEFSYVANDISKAITSTSQTRRQQLWATQMLQPISAAVKTKPLISKENAQNRPETIQRGQLLGVSAFREQIGNSTVKRRWPLCPVCRNTSRKNGRSFLMSVAGRNITSFAGNAKGAASRNREIQAKRHGAVDAINELLIRFAR